MNKDEILLSEAYAKIYNEGIWDRLKGQASGIGAGLRQGAQNLASKAAGALGADVKPTGQGMGVQTIPLFFKEFVGERNKKEGTIWAVNKKRLQQQS